MCFVYGILAQLGEHLPYKQRVIGSSPIGPTFFADVAQLAEQLICNQQVNGSSPLIGLARELSESRLKAADELSRRHVDAVSECESKTKHELTSRRGQVRLLNEIKAKP